MSNQILKDMAVEFLTLVASGKVSDAYERYVRDGFRHHNPYFQGDAASLREAMQMNAPAIRTKFWKSSFPAYCSTRMIVAAPVYISSALRMVASWSFGISDNPCPRILSMRTACSSFAGWGQCLSANPTILPASAVTPLYYHILHTWGRLPALPRNAFPKSAFGVDSRGNQEKAGIIHYDGNAKSRV
jgi:hypothetical protein